MKSTIILITTPPYSGTQAREAIDLVYAFASFSQQVTPVFLNDGVYQLIQQQRSEEINHKSISKMLSALPMFGVDKVFYDEPALHPRGILAEDLLSIALPLDRTALSDYLAQADAVYRF